MTIYVVIATPEAGSVETHGNRGDRDCFATAIALRHAGRWHSNLYASSRWPLRRRRQQWRIANRSARNLPGEKKIMLSNTIKKSLTVCTFWCRIASQNEPSSFRPGFPNTAHWGAEPRSPLAILHFQFFGVSFSTCLAPQHSGQKKKKKIWDRYGRSSSCFIASSRRKLNPIS